MVFFLVEFLVFDIEVGWLSIFVGVVMVKLEGLKDVIRKFVLMIWC